MPTIFAGINQTIMMALAMVIIASMIGVKGLGLEVLRSITNQYLAIGLLNGTAIVVIAIIFDRISQAYGKRVQEHRKGGHPLMANTKIKIENLYKIFGRNSKDSIELVENGMSKDELLEKKGHVLGLNNINMSIEESSVHVVMGLSGSGKSTLIRHINRLIDPTGGKVEVDGQDITQLDVLALNEFRKNKTGMVFQRFGLPAPSKHSR
jgi:ABC-type multidrug transport system fused ATPase/permease subunit